MSRVTYTDEERELKFGKAEAFSLALVLFLVAFSLYEGFALPYLVSSLALSIPLTAFRKRELLSAYGQLKAGKEYSVENRNSRARRESRTNSLVLILLFFAPLIALYVLPVPINLFSALGVVSAYPLSNVINLILVALMERSLEGKVYSFWEIVEVNNEMYVKRFGYRLRK